VSSWAGGHPIHGLRLALSDVRRLGRLGRFVYLSRTIPGWCRDEEAVALAKTSRSLGPDATLVELGSFMGSSTVLMAGGRKLAGSGTVHCVDPFDGSGDEFSVPYYQAIAGAVGRPLQDEFERNVERAGLTSYVKVHKGVAVDIAASFREPIDLLFMDGDQSPDGVRDAYNAWAPLLKVGGILAVHSSTSTEPGHDGSWRLARDVVRAPQYEDIRLIRTTTFARKAHP
jgi:predicted O-methyltransferase YrrM